MLSAILICCTSAMTLTSCVVNDNPVDNKPVNESIYGLWYALQEYNGSLNGLSCRFIGQAAEFNQDGTGVWYFFLLNDAKEPLYVMGGKAKDYGHFHYTLADDGTISISLDTDPTKHVWTMKYQNGKVITPLQPDVVTSQAETRASTRAEVVTGVLEMTSATNEEKILVNNIDGVLFVPAKVIVSLKDTDGNPVQSKTLVASYNGGHYSVKNSMASSEFTVSLSPSESKTLMLAAHIGSDTYVMTKKNLTLEKGEQSIDATLMKVEAVQLWKDGPKFANMNLGATSEAEYGLYYAWGATTDFWQMWVSYDWPNAPYFSGDPNARTNIVDGAKVSFSKYNGDDYDVLESEDDAATVNWGNGWRMPTVDEWNTLIDPEICKMERATVGDFGGYKVTGLTKGYTDKSIFLPGGDKRIRKTFLNDEFNIYGYYWSSNGKYNTASMIRISPTFDPRFAYTSTDYRCYGYSIRPVR